MEAVQDVETIHLPAKAIWTSTSAQVIRCRSGQVWLTDAAAVDYILRPGDERTVRGLVVLEALEPVQLLVASRRRQTSERGGLLWNIISLPMTWRWWRPAIRRSRQ